MSAVSFTMTIHSLMDYKMDKKNADQFEKDENHNLIQKYIEWFCNENKVE